MFSLFKSSKEKQLIRLGFQTLIDSYYAKLKSKEWTKEEWKAAIDQLYEQNKTAVFNADNVNVATRQSFVDDEVLVPLNLQNIQQEYIDYDFIYSSLIYEYKNYQRVHSRAIVELIKYLKEKFPKATVDNQCSEQLKQLSTKDLIDKATQEITEENASYMASVFEELKNRL